MVVIYVFLLEEAMYSSCCLCILRRGYPDWGFTICCKNLSLTLLMMGKILPETCWN